MVPRGSSSDAGVSRLRDVRHSKAVQQAQMASAGSLLSQVHGVATLAKILSRYRQSRHIMWSVYRHSVLAWYEQTAAQYIADHVAASQAAAAAPGTEGTPAALVRSATSRRRLNAKAVRAPIRMSERTLPPLDVAHLLSRQQAGRRKQLGAAAELCRLLADVMCKDGVYGGGRGGGGGGAERGGSLCSGDCGARG